MSWINRLENIEFTITTGDGKMFKPLWKNGEKSKEFNISKYDFINVEGSFIDRKKASANQYPLIFWFQGEDNIEQCDEFELSANDNRYWTIEHPFYGTIKGQPTNLKRSDKDYNVTEVSVNFWESLTDDYPAAEISFKDEIQSKTNNLNKIAIDFAVENSVPKSSDSKNLLNGIPQLSAKFKPDSANFNNYNAAINKSLISASNLISEPFQAYQDFQDLISTPAFFISTVDEKINSYVESYQILAQSIESLFSKYFFESNGASILAGMCLSAINGTDNDFVTRNDIINVNNQINTIYEEYLETLDNNQVSIYEINDSWNANINIQNDLLDLITFTSNSLFLLSFNARQEREFELLKDSNLIVLTHRFVGLDVDDKNIDKFREINNIKNNELYKIKKGRTIKYFV